VGILVSATASRDRGMACNPQQPDQRRAFGLEAETLAVQFLANRGLHILLRNYTCPFGELDIVARDKDTVVFVEVRSTASGSALRPALSIDTRKQRRLYRIAEYFLSKHRLLDRPARFDVVLVVENCDANETATDNPGPGVLLTGTDGKPRQIIHYVNALQFSG
jgi:putative endonuclease